MVTVKGLTHLAKMKELPEAYSGRGAIFSDLNGNQLYAMYDEIKKGLGEKPAAEFIKMIDDIKCLSAYTFLKKLYCLEADNWIYNPNSSIEITEIAESTSTYFCIKPRKRDDTMSIKNCFHFFIDGKRYWY